MVTLLREILTPEQVADHLQVQQRTVQDWLRSGTLPGIKLGRLWRVRRVDLEGFLKLRQITSGVGESDAMAVREYASDEIEQMLQLDRLDAPASAPR
ncbi:MAG TPA: helix-turn-helix domain-containing protein [Armatimonadota bacterium]|jgi:excisionase family DNA binding protein